MPKYVNEIQTAFVCLHLVRADGIIAWGVGLVSKADGSNRETHPAVINKQSLILIQIVLGEKTNS